jgi:hypothetical protein
VGAGALSVTTRAPAGAGEPQPIVGPVPLPLTNVVSGDNVIAVVVIQNGGTSSDIEMALELIATISKFASGPPVITTQPQGQTVNEGQAVNLSVFADGAVPLTYHWSKGGVPIPGANGSSYTISPAVPDDTGTYSVIVSNSLGTATSTPPASVTVNPDLISPNFILALASTNLTNILLTIVDNYGLNPSTVEEAGNYTVELFGGGGGLTVESAVLVNNTNVLLATSPRTQGLDYKITLTDVRDLAVAENVVTPSTRRVVSEIIVLTPNDATLWRYESASNNLDGTLWYTPGFDASLWPQALAGFTTSNNLELTAPGLEVRTTNMLAPSSGGPVTAYYRVNFDFPGTVTNATLHLVGVIDDGLVAYINGVEAGRLRMTNTSPVSFTNLATAASPEASDLHTTESITLTNLSGLVSGANLLAIELHQNATTSSDSVLSVQVVAGTEQFGLRPRLNVSRNGGQVTISWTGGGVLQEATQLTNGATVWTDVPGNPSSPYTFTPTGQMKFYSLRQ